MQSYRRQQFGGHLQMFPDINFIKGFEIAIRSHIVTIFGYFTIDVASEVNG